MKASDVAQYQFQMVASDLLNWNGQDFVLVVQYYSRYLDTEKLYKTDQALKSFTGQVIQQLPTS